MAFKQALLCVFLSLCTNTITMIAAKRLFFALFLMLPFSLLSQEIVDVNKSWSIAQIHCQPWGNAYSTQFYRFEGDTIVDGVFYQKVMISLDANGDRWDFFGAFIREEEGRVYYRELFQEEGLIYDFNLQPGDTVQIDNSRGQEMVHLVLASVDSVAAENGVIEQWTLDCVEYPGNSETWLRGVGSMAGVINSGIDIFGGLCGLYVLLCSEEDELGNSETWLRGVGSMAGVINSGIDIFGGLCGLYVLLCSEEDELLRFQNPEFGSCYLLTTSTNELSQDDLVIYLARSTNALVIDGLVGNHNVITVTDMGGRVLERISTSESKALISRNLKPGLVMVTVVSAQQRITKKVLIP